MSLIHSTHQAACWILKPYKDYTPMPRTHSCLTAWVSNGFWTMECTYPIWRLTSAGSGCVWMTGVKCSQAESKEEVQCNTKLQTFNFLYHDGIMLIFWRECLNYFPGTTDQHWMDPMNWKLSENWFSDSIGIFNQSKCRPSSAESL